MKLSTKSFKKPSLLHCRLISFTITRLKEHMRELKVYHDESEEETCQILKFLLFNPCTELFLISPPRRRLAKFSNLFQRPNGTSTLLRPPPGDQFGIRFSSALIALIALYPTPIATHNSQNNSSDKNLNNLILFFYFLLFFFFFNYSHNQSFALFLSIKNDPSLA